MKQESPVVSLQGPLVSGRLAAVVGAAGALAAFVAGTPLVPWPYNLALGVLGISAGLLTATFSGVPALVVSRPLVPVALIPSCLGLSGLLAEWATSMEASPERGLALAVAAVLSWVAGKAFTPPAPRGGAALAVLLALAAGAAEAGDRNKWYNVTIASAACPTSAPTLTTPGISLSGLKAWNLTVCPQSGSIFTGTGLFRACVYRASPGPMQWTLSRRFYWDMADDGGGNAIVTTLSNPCHTFEDVQVGVGDGDLLYIYPETDIGVSGGSVVSVYLEGQLEVRP